MTFIFLNDRTGKNLPCTFNRNCKKEHQYLIPFFLRLRKKNPVLQKCRMSVTGLQ